MSEQRFRNRGGGRVDRSRALRFTFDGRAYGGFRGDTLASALLANGVRVVGRSLKYHRPRGVFAAGAEEPNALVQLGRGWSAEPNTRATELELFEGLTAASQNCWPDVEHDVGAAAGLLAPLLPAGFYYKTFLGTPRRWLLYERFIRRAAGLGRAPREADRDRYEKRSAHCDVLVAGGGPAGLAAALAAARSGARVILAEQDFELGGSLLGQRAQIDSAPALDWVSRTTAALLGLVEVQILRRATVFGYYDHNLLGILEKVGEQVGEQAGEGAAGAGRSGPRQRLWKVRARRVVLATGAIERPLVFAGNDRPGVMLASAARAYVNRFAVRPGSRAVIFTNNDSAWGAAQDLAACGVEVAAVVDARTELDGGLPARARRQGIPCLPGSAVVSTRGRKQLASVEVMALNASGDGLVGDARRIACDLLCVSGGWSPTLHLHAQARGRPAWDPLEVAFVPGSSVQAERSAGAARGVAALGACIADGFEAGAAAARAAGFESAAPPPRSDVAAEDTAPPRALWLVPLAGRGKRFVDLQNDVTADDVALAAREGYDAVEHLKRYTTLGMGTDQGKTSNVNGLGILAGLRGRPIPEVGVTTFRPPYTPVTLGALAGRESGPRLDPVRRTPMHGWHERAGAVFSPSGLWLRARHYPRRGEGLLAAANREARAVRENVGMVDVSTLGKIDVQGPDAAEFLNRVYINGWKSLPVGRARYGVMLREDGIIFDDGTTTRLAEHHYLMTTTTANAPRVMAHLEFYLQMVWPELRVHVTSVTDQWAAMALAGPNSRTLLQRLVEDVDVSDQALPFMGFSEGRVAGAPARIFRISFSGELGYEINVPADYGLGVWEAIMVAGESMEITPYGLEAMDILRIEKGHLIVGTDIDGRVTPYDVGLDRMLSTRKEFIGKRWLEQAAFQEPDRERLVGLRSADGRSPIPPGAQILAEADAGSAPQRSLGRVTSTAFSPALECPIALALVSGGVSRREETLHAVSPLTGERAAVIVTAPMFFDPEGERLRG